jgi:hypothetical protein
MTPGGDGACWGRNPGGSVWAVWALSQTGPQTRSAPKRALRRTESRFLALKPSAGMNGPWAPLAGPRRPLPRPRGPCESNRHIRPRFARFGGVLRHGSAEWGSGRPVPRSQGL